MKFTLPRVVLSTFTLGSCASALAQESVPIEYYRPLKNSFSVGARMLGGKANVGFSNLGNIPMSNTSFEGNASRAYDNGRVGADADRAVPVSTVSSVQYRRESSGGRYQDIWTLTNTDGTTEERILYDHLEYLDGYTRNWGYNSASQYDASSNYVDMSSYGVAPAGGTATAASDDGAGVELQFARVIKRGKRFEWGVNLSAGLSDINAKVRQQIRGNLLTTTDRYNLRAGSAAGGDGFDSSLNEETRDAMTSGTAPSVAYQYSYEREHYLDLNATRIRDAEVTPDGADVSGYWQIKGAYYLLRVGPTARFQLSKNWTVSAGAGFAGAFVGSRFIADEFITVNTVNRQLRNREEGEEKAFVSGYYADVNIERWLTVRTGFYLGYSTEKIGDYTHELRGRRAEVDFDSSSGFRFGIITRF